MRNVFWALLFLVIIATIAFGQASRAPFVEGIRVKDTVHLEETRPMLWQFSPPKIYAAWLVDIAVCVGLSLPTNTQAAQLKFIAVNSANFQINKDTLHTVRAVTDPYASKMYVSLPSMFVKRDIQHEFLHFLLYWRDSAYDGGHPAEYFGVCGINYWGTQ